MFTDADRSTLTNDLVELIVSSGYVVCEQFDYEHPQKYRLQKCEAGIEFLHVVLNHINKTKVQAHSLPDLIKSFTKLSLSDAHLGGENGFVPDSPNVSKVHATLKKWADSVEVIWKAQRNTAELQKDHPFELHENALLTITFNLFKNAGEKFFGKYYAQLKIEFDQIDRQHSDRSYSKDAPKILAGLDAAHKAMVQLSSEDGFFAGDKKPSVAMAAVSGGSSKPVSYDPNQHWEDKDPSWSCNGCGRRGGHHLFLEALGRKACPENTYDPDLYEKSRKAKAEKAAARRNDSSGGGGGGGGGDNPKNKSKKSKVKTPYSAFLATNEILVKDGKLVSKYTLPCFECSVSRGSVCVCFCYGQVHACSPKAWRQAMQCLVSWHPMPFSPLL